MALLGHLHFVDVFFIYKFKLKIIGGINMKKLYNFSDYQKNDKDFYESIDKKLDYLQSQMNYILSEQEKQRYEQMTMTEIVQEMLKIQKEMRETLNKMLERWGEK